jgi:ankyrin repeat protein
MRTARSLKWLLSLLPLVTVLFVIQGQAAADNPLVTAAKSGDIATVKALIAKRVNVNEPSSDGSTALLWAAYHSDLDMTRALLAAGATVNVTNRYGVTPLLQASRSGATPVVQALVRAGADAKKSGLEVETPLMAAARTGRVENVKLLLEAGADVNATDANQEQTALMWAATEGHADVITALLAAGANANAKARVNTITERKNSDFPTGGFTALMYAAREGHEAAVRALVAGGADPKLTNGDGATAMAIAIVNDRFDLAKTMLDLGADANDGSLFFAVDMHDATSDMRAKDGSRLRADFDNKLTALDLVKALLDKGADPNKPFVGRLHHYALCCDADVNASPFFRAAQAADVEALKLMIAKGAQVEWSPTEVKKAPKPDGAAAGPGRGNPNVGRTPMMVAINGGRGAAFNAGPGFDRLTAPPFREASSREPFEAIKVLLAAGANPNAKAPDGSSLLHQAVSARQVPIIDALIKAGAKLDAVNKDNLTPLLLAEKPEPPPPPGNNTDSRTYRPKRNTRDEVIAALRTAMGLKAEDPAPQPPPLPASEQKKDEKKPADDAEVGA